MFSSYLDVDDILASETRLPCRLLCHDFPMHLVEGGDESESAGSTQDTASTSAAGGDTGSLQSASSAADASSDGKSAGSQSQSQHAGGTNVGRKVDMPYWMVEALMNARPEQPPVSVQCCRPYSRAYRPVLAADAKVCNLAKMAPHYYTLGAKLVTILPEQEAPAVARSLLNTFQHRLGAVMDSAQHALGTGAPDHLEQTERRLHAIGRRAQDDYERWKRGEAGRIEGPPGCRNSRKRPLERSAVH